MITYFLAALLIARVVKSDGNTTIRGSCVSEVFEFDPARTYLTNDNGTDLVHYDWKLNSKDNSIVFDKGSANLSIIKTSADVQAQGTMIQTVRKFMYGQFTVRLKAASMPGVVTTIYALTEDNSEMDFYLTGGSNGTAQINAFYNGSELLPQTNTILVPVDNGIGSTHDYTFDWQHQAMTWLIDNKKVYQFSAVGNQTTGGVLKTPITVKVAVWDGGSMPDRSIWAGGPIQTLNQPISTKISSLTVQCYDEHDIPVQKYPNDATNPSRSGGINVKAPIQIIIAVIAFVSGLTVL